MKAKTLSLSLALVLASHPVFGQDTQPNHSERDERFAPLVCAAIALGLYVFGRGCAAVAELSGEDLSQFDADHGTAYPPLFVFTNPPPFWMTNFTSGVTLNLQPALKAWNIAPLATNGAFLDPSGAPYTVFVKVRLQMSPTLHGLSEDANSRSIRQWLSSNHVLSLLADGSGCPLETNLVRRGELSSFGQDAGPARFFRAIAEKP